MLPVNQQVHIITNPLAQHKLTVLRDKNTTKDSFRATLRDIGLMLTIEMTAQLDLVAHPIETPLAPTTGKSLDLNRIGFVSILRAGNGLLDGALSILPGVACGFIGAERDHKTLQIRIYYEKLPTHAESRTFFIFDPMLATGHTLCAVIDILKKKNPLAIYVGSVLAAPEGVELVHKCHPDVKLFTLSVDERLNEKSYIMPGLGDAGDRLYGTL